jgi:O-antigen/teichoic acid export membrane protein
MVMYGRGIQFFSQLALVLILPKALIPALFAEFNLLIPLVSLGITFVFGWLTSSLNRHVYELLGPENHRTRQTALIYYGGASLLMLALFVVLAIVTDSIYRLVPLLLVSIGLRDAILGILNMSSNHRGFLIANIGFALSLMFFIALCYFSPQDDLADYLVIYGFVDATLAVIAWYMIGVARIKPFPRFNTKIAGKYFKYGFPLVLRGLPIWIISVSDRYLLAIWVSSDLLSGYILAYQLAGSIITIPMSFAMLILFPKILRIDKEKGEVDALAFTYKLLGYYYRYMVGIIVFAWAVVAGVKYYVYPEYYFHPLLPGILVVAHVIQGLVHFYNKEFELNGKTMIITKGMVVGAITNVALNLILIPFFDVVGAAISTLVAYTVTIFMIYRAREYRPA